MTLSPPLQQVDRTYVRLGRRKLSYFGGCDYFRLSSHPKILKAVTDGLKRYGLTVSASRFTTGNHKLYETLERQIAKFFQAECATFSSNGYVPNLVVAQALAGQFSHALIDERAHASLADAAQLLGCPILKFKHRDATDLARVLGRLGTIKPLVLTDGVFSHDGSIAPVKEYLAALPAGAMLLLDDAHGAGVLGKSGRGTPEHAGVSTEHIIQTITFSKAFGVYGGAVLGSARLRTATLERSRLLVGNTPLPLPLANAVLEAIHILKADGRLRERLIRNTAHVKGKLVEGGLELMESPAPIISIAPANARQANDLRRRLLAKGIHPPFIKYPGGPASGYFRFAICSEHSKRQLDALTEALLPANG